MSAVAVRHLAPGGGAVGFPVGAGARVVVTDASGGQPAELRFDAGVALQLLGAAAPGSAASWTAAAAGWCEVSAPGAPMAPDAQDAPTELAVEVFEVDGPAGIAPPPLAAPKLDLRIDAGTARAYTVAAGDYIQVIDVDGRQCSDFVAFDAQALAAGREMAIDPTVTRTLTGTAFPAPGLHGKYFDAAMRPMLELVRDTVGRHDTFLLACTPKYYEDAGYPGHPSCSDNFNACLAPFGVAARAGWPAINFFYNTFAQGEAIGMDEPWSRPGDYVLLRALTDLVCASSSCPDDIDPANGWQPTDIHVRVYDAAEFFSPGRAHRVTPDAAARLTRETGFSSRTAALSRDFREYRGFRLPGSFFGQDTTDEYWACRESAVMMDLSALQKFEVTGPDAAALMQWALTRDIRKLAVGQVVYSAMCHEHGGMFDDGTAFRLGEHNFRWVCGEEYAGTWLRELARMHGLRAWVRCSTDQLHNIAVQGPNSRAILRDILATPPGRATLDELRWFRFTVGRIGGAAVVVSRTGYTGELGYEIWCHPTQAPAIWDAVAAAGATHGLRPMGLDALDIVRVEAGLAFSGHEFGDAIDPFEAGLGFTVAADKPGPYVGRDALERRRASPRQKLVGLAVTGADMIGHGDPVCRGRAQVGVVTSAVRSPALGIVGLARVDVSAADDGAALEVGRLDGHQKRIAVRVTGFPAYDPGKTRVRA